jgi:hypothetical protein
MCDFWQFLGFRAARHLALHMARDIAAALGADDA